MPSVPESMILTQPEIKVIQRLRSMAHGSIVIKIQDGVPVFLQKIIEDVKLV
jgi:hypothetical protein